MTSSTSDAGGRSWPGLLAARGDAGGWSARQPRRPHPSPVPRIGGPLHAEMYPSGLEAAPDGTVVVADTGNNRIARYNADGTLVWSVGTHGAGTDQFDNPRDVGVDADNNVYVADTRNSRIVKLSPSGAWLDSTTGPSTAFSFQLGVTVKGNRVYVGDTGRHRIVVLDLDLRHVIGRRHNGACTNSTATAMPQADCRRQRLRRGLQDQRDRQVRSRRHLPAQVGQHRLGPGQFRTPYGVATQHRPGHRPGAALRRRRPQQPRPGVHADRPVRHPVRHLRRARRGRHVHHDASGRRGRGRHRQRLGAPTCGATGSSAGTAPRPASPTTGPSARPCRDTDRARVFHEPRGMAFAPQR